MAEDGGKVQQASDRIKLRNHRTAYKHADRTLSSTEIDSLFKGTNSYTSLVFVSWSCTRTFSKTPSTPSRRFSVTPRSMRPTTFTRSSWWCQERMQSLSDSRRDGKGRGQNASHHNMLENDGMASWHRVLSEDTHPSSG